MNITTEKTVFSEGQYITFEEYTLDDFDVKIRYYKADGGKYDTTHSHSIMLGLNPEHRVELFNALGAEQYDRDFVTGTFNHPDDRLLMSKTHHRSFDYRGCPNPRSKGAKRDNAYAEMLSVDRTATLEALVGKVNENVSHAVLKYNESLDDWHKELCHRSSVKKEIDHADPTITQAISTIDTLEAQIKGLSQLVLEKRNTGFLEWLDRDGVDWDEVGHRSHDLLTDAIHDNKCFTPNHGEMFGGRRKRY